MADENTAPNSLSSLAAAFGQAQPVQAPQQENAITYNSTYDRTTDEYGAPINQPNPQPQPQQPQPQQPFQQPNPQQIDQNLITQFFDPNVTTITVADPNNPAPTTPVDPNNQMPAVFQQLADTIAAATNNNPADPAVSPMTEIFNTAYGDDIDFAQMMADEGDPATINTNMQSAVRSKMEAVYANAITQSVSLAQQLIDRKFTEFQTTLQTQQSQQSAIQQLQQRLPFTSQPEFAGLSQMLLTQAMSKTNNNVAQSIATVEQLFRLSNPNQFGKPNNTRFGAPNNNAPQGRSGPTTLSLDTIDQFMS